MKRKTSICSAWIAAFCLALAGCATKPLQTERHVKGTPQPDRWQQFLEHAKRGKIEQVADEPEESSTSLRLIAYHLGRVTRAGTQPGANSEIFSGKFRPEAKTSCASVWRNLVSANLQIGSA